MIMTVMMVMVSMIIDQILLGRDQSGIGGFQ